MRPHSFLILGFVALAATAVSPTMADGPTTPMALWKGEHYTSEQILANTEAADAAQVGPDGTPNLLRYAWGLAPSDSVTGVLPSGEIIENQLHLHFQRVEAALDISYVVEVSGELATWASGASLTEVVSVASIGGGIELVTVRDKTLMNDVVKRRFMRLRVERTQTDTDGDGLPDDWEVAHFGSLSRNGSGDYDGDGFTDLEEFQMGLDPGVDDAAVSAATYSYDNRGQLLGITSSLSFSFAFDLEGNVTASN